MVKNLICTAILSCACSAHAYKAYELEDLFDQLLINPFGLHTITHQNRLNISQDEQTVTLEMEVPGYTKDELSIELDESGRRISISAQKNKSIEKTDDANNSAYREFKAQSFQRSDIIPQVTADGVITKLENGILTITLQKVDPKRATTRIAIDN